jgi:hypothetical protein
MAAHLLPDVPRRYAHPADPLARARGLVVELLEMVAQVRARAAELEAERDQLELERDELRRQLAQPAGGPPEPEAEEPVDHKARHGDMGRAMATVLEAPRRRRPGLTGLLGGDRA